MRKAISILVIIALAVIGIGASQNFQGNAKGPDDPRAEVVGENQSLPVLALSGQKSMDLGNQALGKTGHAFPSGEGTVKIGGKDGRQHP